MNQHDLREAVDAGDINAVRTVVTAQRELVGTDIEWRDAHGVYFSEPLGYIGLARFHGLTDHDRMGEIARVLLAAGAPVDGVPGCTETPLITAASYGEPDVASALIGAGADLEATGFAVPEGTALAHALYFGNVEVAEILLAAGARVRSVVEAAGTGDLRDFLDGEMSPAESAGAIRAAAVCERLPVIDRLLAAGIDIHAQTDGATPLHWTAWHGKSAATRHLVARGADPTRREPAHDGTPLDWCRYRHARLHQPSPGHQAVERYLESLASHSS